MPTSVRDLLPQQYLNAPAPTDFETAIDNVVLTDEEEQEAIKNAKVRKYWKVREESQKQMLEAMRNEILRPWTWKDQYDYLWVRCEELKIPAAVLSAIMRENEWAVRTLCEYFTRDADFENRGEGYSLHKGIYLHGYTGTGKTTLMTLFARNKKQCYYPSRCLELQQLFIREADDLITAMSSNVYQPKDPRYFFQKETGRYFDDFGTEEHPINIYGTKRNFMGEIIMNRYDNRSITPRCSTHISSNRNPFEEVNGSYALELEYGTRFWDRFRDMFNVIELKGDSLRG